MPTVLLRKRRKRLSEGEIFLTDGSSFPNVNMKMGWKKKNKDRRMKRSAADVARLLTARRTDTHDGTLNDVPAQTRAQPGCHNYIGKKIENICMCTRGGKSERGFPVEANGRRKSF